MLLAPRINPRHNPAPVTAGLMFRILDEHALVDPDGGKLEALIQGLMREAGKSREDAERLARSFLGIRTRRN